MKVAMVGCAPTWTQAPYDDPAWEIWAHASCQCRFVEWSTRPRVTRWFDLHALSVWRQGKVWFKPHSGDPATYVEWLAMRPEPVVMQQHWPIVPTSRAYPLQAVVEHFNIVPKEWDLTPADPRWWGFVKNRGEFSSTFAYMLALALYEGAEEVSLYGIDFAGTSAGPSGAIEYRDQRPGAKYWVGIARGLGVPVTVARGSWFEQQAALYGYELPQLQEV